MMLWQPPAALLILALASAGQSVPEIEESTSSHAGAHITEENPIEAGNKDSATFDQNKTNKAILKTLLHDFTKSTSMHSPNGPFIQTTLQSLAIALQTFTLTDYNVVTDNVSTLGIFSDPGHGVYLGTNWTRWDIGVPQGGHFAANQGLGTALWLDQVVGVVIEGITPRKTVLVATRWTSKKIDDQKYERPYFEHVRKVDAFLYEAEGDEVGVQVFWEPFSVDGKRVRCATWVPGQEWDAGRCKTGWFGAGLVGCRCRGTTFGDPKLRRASFLVVEESESFMRREDLKNFKRSSLFLHNHNVDHSGLKEIGRLINELLIFKPDLFFKPDNKTYGVLLDIGSEVHGTNLTRNDSVLVHIGKRTTLVVAEGDGGTPLNGLYVGKRWPTDNPEEAAFHATGLRPGGSLLEAKSDTEVFAVRIVGNGSLPQRASLLLTNWDENSVQWFFSEVVTITQRVADVVFSAEHDDAELGDLEVVFETPSRHWTTIRCKAWDFHKSVWDDKACSSHSNISLRLHLCTCRKALHKIEDLYRARIFIAEETSNHQSFADWDLFNRTSHHIGYLAKLSLPSEQLPNITALLDTYILGEILAHDFVLPSRLLDDLAAILHRLDLESDKPTAFSWRSGLRSTAAMFVQGRVNESLATIAITNERGLILNSTENDANELMVAVNFNPPQNGSHRVSLTYIAISKSVYSVGSVSHSEIRLVDVSLHPALPLIVDHEVVLRLKSFVDTKQLATVRFKTCRYWDFYHRDWSEGCLIRLDNGKELCQCMIPTIGGVVGRARFHIASDWSEQKVYSSLVSFGSKR